MQNVIHKSRLGILVDGKGTNVQALEWRPVSCERMACDHAQGSPRAAKFV
jgi:hypothetical protein